MSIVKIKSKTLWPEGTEKIEARKKSPLNFFLQFMRRESSKNRFPIFAISFNDFDLFSASISHRFQTLFEGFKNVLQTTLRLLPLLYMFTLLNESNAKMSAKFEHGSIWGCFEKISFKVYHVYEKAMRKNRYQAIKKPFALAQSVFWEVVSLNLQRGKAQQNHVLP